MLHYLKNEMVFAFSINFPSLKAIITKTENSKSAKAKLYLL